MPQTKKSVPKAPTADELWPKRRREFTWVGENDRRGARRVLDIVRKNKSTALDTEFPTHGPRQDEAIIWSLSGAANQRFVLHGRWLQSDSPFADWIADRDTKLVYFSFPADADVIEKNTKVDCEPSFYADVKVTGWLRNNTKRRIALKEEAADYLNNWRRDYTHMFGYFPYGKKKWVTVPPDVLMEGPLPKEMLDVMSWDEWIKLFQHYSADDADDTHTLHRINKVVLRRWGYWPTYLMLDKPYTITLRHFSKRGIPINFEELNRLDREVTTELLRHRTCLQLLAGADTTLSLNSQSKALRKLIFDDWGWPTYDDLQTDSGQPQLNKVAWHRYATEEGFTFARLMLPHNKLTTLKNTFLNGIRYGTMYGPGAKTNTLFSEYNQTGTRQGRMSSRKFKVRIPVLRTYKTRPSKWVDKEVKAGMNMLNFPAKHSDVFGVRRVVTAPPPDEESPDGYQLICGDFAGFELWMILYWCHKWGIKSKMLKYLMDDVSVHALTAIRVMGLNCTWQECKEKYPKQYDTGKKCNFGLGYGASWRVFCAILGWDARSAKIERLVKRIIATWNEMWPEMPAYQEHCVALGYKQGWVPSIAGGRTWVREGLDSEDEGTVRHFENICKNGPAQRSAAEITKMAQNFIERDRRMREMGYRQGFNVYDEIIGWVPRRHAEEATARQAKLMKKPGKVLGLPFELRVECHHSDNWRDAK